MLAAALKRIRALRNRCLHGLLLIGLVPKFLVPLGYMPAAFADGGPLMLCDTFAPVPTAVDSPRRHTAHDGPGAPNVPGAHGVHGAPAVTTAHDHHAEPGHGNDGAPASSENDDPAEWERCSLGGLAALTAVTTDWRIALVARADERAAPAVSLIDSRANRVAFRSRAPPAAWNSVF